MINKEGKNVDGLTVYEVSCDECSTGSEEYEAEDWEPLIRTDARRWVEKNQ